MYMLLFSIKQKWMVIHKVKLLKGKNTKSTIKREGQAEYKLLFTKHFSVSKSGE